MENESLLENSPASIRPSDAVKKSSPNPENKQNRVN